MADATIALRTPTVSLDVVQRPNLLSRQTVHHVLRLAVREWVRRWVGYMVLGWEDE